MSMFKRSRRGFSLIELAVVVAIIGILAAIAIPTFLGQRKGAQDRSAQSDLRNVAVQGRATAAANNSVYDSGVIDTIDDDEPAIAIDEGVVGAGTPPVVVSGAYISSTQVAYMALSDSGTCWIVFDDLDSGTFYARQDMEVTGDACNAALIVTTDTAGTATGEITVDSNHATAGYEELESDFASAVDLDEKA